MTKREHHPVTSRTRVAIAIARAIAEGRGDAVLGPIHVTAGIFREGANPALAALWYAGLSETSIRSLGSEIEHFLDREPTGVPPKHIVLDANSGEDELTKLAQAEVDRRGDPYLGTEHFLLSILRSDNAVTRRFADFGIDSEKFETSLSAVLRGDPPPSQTPAV